MSKIEDGSNISPVKQQIQIEPDALSYDVMPELTFPLAEEPGNAQGIIYKESNGPEIMEVFEWLKSIGPKKNWVYQNYETGLARNLVRLARGQPVDFLIWNCIGFAWYKDTKGEMPTCSINDNLDAAITRFFAKRIQELCEYLALIGNPQFNILLPSNEALNETGVWKYRQSREERENVINTAIVELQKYFDSFLTIPSNSSVMVRRWDDYLKLAGAGKQPDEYSKEGTQRLKRSNNFKSIVKEGVESGEAYFAQNGITNISRQTLADREVMYYGVYAGEGVAYEELQKKGRGIIVVNFEEMRVSQMSFLGSEGKLTIVTPIKTSEMADYYRFEAERIKERKIK